MSNAKSPDDSTTTPYVDAPSKFKRFIYHPLEPSLGAVSFLFFTALFLSSCFYLDYSSVTQRLRTTGQYWLGLGSSSSQVPAEDGGSGGVEAVVNGRPSFLDGGCDAFDGSWVWDANYPLYESKDCALLDGGFRCIENGRPDEFYTKWRWQPRLCDLPRFDGKLMLEKLRDRRVVFVGDSIGRNQWESLLCMLSSAVTDKASIYEENGSSISKHTGFLVFRFRDFNCTIEYYRSPFLVVQGRAPAGSPKEVKTTLKLDLIDWTAYRWVDADLLVLNSGHWWNYEKTIRGGCYFQIGDEVDMNMTIDDAYRRSLETVVGWISSHANLSKTHIYFRSYAPVHFTGGDWRSGGTCHLESMPDLSSPPVPENGYMKSLLDVLTRQLNGTVRSRFDVLNITAMTARRKDGHSSLFYMGPGQGLPPLHRQDCSHWCLPGVPDAWNELLYALFLKHESLRS